jgi:hypothetical protein
VDEDQARQLLGLDAGPLTTAAIRQARNAALKAHHPDLAGQDAGAARRATYWSTQINTAFELLNATLHSEPSTPRQADTAKQSFAAASRRAEERAERERLTLEEEAARQRAAEEDSARERIARESAAAAKRVAATSQAQQQAHTERIRSAIVSRVPAHSHDRVGKLALVSGVIVLAITAVVVMASSPGSPTPSSQPTNMALKTAAASAPTTAIATPSPAPTERPARLSFDYWVSAYGTSILPCYLGGHCDLEADVPYPDGTKATLASELYRLASLFRDQTVLEQDGVTMCREEHASLYALASSMSAETALIKTLKPDETVPTAWRPSQAVKFEPCTTLVRDYPASAGELNGLLAVTRTRLVKARQDVKAGNWADARKVAVQLTGNGMNIARRAARDFPSGEGDTWKPLRTLGWDVVRVSGNLGIERIAKARSTSDLIDACIASIDASPLRTP